MKNKIKSKIRVLIIYKKFPAESKTISRLIICIKDVIHCHVHKNFEILWNLSGLLPHELWLIQISIPFIFLTNWNPPHLYNGPRLVIKDLKVNLIMATICIGPDGQLTHIPRIPMISMDLSISYQVSVHTGANIFYSQGWFTEDIFFIDK